MKSLNEIRKEATAGTATTKSMFGRSVDWIGRNEFGDVVEYDTFHSDGNSYYAEFYGYDSFGNRIAATNALGAVTSCAYDTDNRLVESSGAVYPVRYGYDTDGRRTSLTTFRDAGGPGSVPAAAGDTTSWTFDPATGFCTVKTYADGSTVTYTRTPDGLFLRETKPSGAWKENVYDVVRQIVGIVSSDGALDVLMTRDEFGNVTSESNAVAFAEYSLDAHGSVTNEVQTVDGVSASFLRDFDSYGRLTRFARVGGESIGIEYSAVDGALAVVSNTSVSATYAFTSDRLDAGYSLAVQGCGLFTRSQIRDAYRRGNVIAVTNTFGNSIVGLTYSYDALDRPISRNADTFGYNERGEVVFSHRDAENAEDAYTYDDIGNLLYSADNSATNTYVSNNRNQYTSILRDSATPRETSYDLDGNLTQCGEWAYAYDSGNRLVSASSNGVVVATFAYDAQGRRVKKVAADRTHRYFYDGWLLVYEHIVHPDNTTSEVEYVWGKDVSGTRAGAAGIGGLLYLKRDGVIYVPWYDAYGNILGYCDSQGNLVASYACDAFGNTLSQSGPLADAFSLRFSTKYFDFETFLYYYGYRYYKPGIMSWMTEDPIEEEGGLNMHGFCGNNAVGHYDALGQSWLDCFGKCVEDWRLDWSKIFTSANGLLSSNVPIPKTAHESLWIKDGVSKDTTYLSRAISKGVQLAMKLPLGNPIRAKLISSLKEVRHFMRNPAMIGAGSAGAVLTVFEGFYDIGTMLYCAGHCCGK